MVWCVALWRREALVACLVLSYGGVNAKDPDCSSTFNQKVRFQLPITVENTETCGWVSRNQHVCLLEEIDKKVPLYEICGAQCPDASNCKFREGPSCDSDPETAVHLTFRTVTCGWVAYNQRFCETIDARSNVLVGSVCTSQCPDSSGCEFVEPPQPTPPPSAEPTPQPSPEPTPGPSRALTPIPTLSPSLLPTSLTSVPTAMTFGPTASPTRGPSAAPILADETSPPQRATPMPVAQIGTLPPSTSEVELTPVPQPVPTPRPTPIPLVNIPQRTARPTAARDVTESSMSPVTANNLDPDSRVSEATIEGISVRFTNVEALGVDDILEWTLVTKEWFEAFFRGEFALGRRLQDSFTSCSLTSDISFVSQSVSFDEGDPTNEIVYNQRILFHSDETNVDCPIDGISSLSPLEIAILPYEDVAANTRLGLDLRINVGGFDDIEFPIEEPVLTNDMGGDSTSGSKKWNQGPNFRGVLLTFCSLALLLFS